MKVLVVGAGAVGQVYGRHAQLGGAEVTFFVREKYRAELASGFELYALNRRGKAAKTQPIRFTEFSVVTTADEVRAKAFDLAILTVSSPALRGPWLAEVVGALGPAATILALQPGTDDRDVIVAAGATPAQIVSGVITLISYHAPLPGETRFPAPGMAYWFPPMAPSYVSGDDAARVEVVVRALHGGGLPTKRHANVPAFSAFPTAIMMPYLVALESAGWSFRALAKGPIALGARGAREAMAVVGHAAGIKAPFMTRMLARPRVLRFGLWFGRRIVPLPLEIYLKQHFTKVGDQTRMFMADYIARGRGAGLPIDALDKLVTNLPQLGA